MKICPQCRTTYTDETLQFCLQDGTPLASQAPSNNWTESETLVSPSKSWEQPSQVTQVSALQPEPKKSNTAKVVLLTVLGMLLLFGLAGLGAWLYLKPDRNEVTQRNTNKPANNTNANVKTTNTGYLGNTNSSPKPSPQPSLTPSPSPTRTPANFDPEQVKSEVSNKIDNWKSSLESGNLNAFVNNYADRMDYYFNSNGISRAEVFSDKQRAFSRFDSFDMKISNLRITPDETGEKATAVFDKEWEFEGADSRNEGKVQSQLQLTKIGGQWRITGERDLKVYYTQ